MKRFVVRQDCIDFEDREYAYIIVDTETKKEFDMSSRWDVEHLAGILNDLGGEQ